MASFTSEDTNRKLMFFLFFILLIPFGFYVTTFTTKLFIQFAFAVFVFLLLLIPSKAMLKAAFAIFIVTFSIGPRSIDVLLLRVFTAEPFIWILFFHVVVKKTINNQALIPGSIYWPANISILLVFLSLFIALAYGDPLDIVFNRMKSIYIFLPIFVIVNYMINNENDLRFALNVFLVSGLIVSVFGLGQFFFPGKTIINKEFITTEVISGMAAPFRTTSFWGHPGVLAQYLFPVSLISLSLCFRKVNFKEKILPLCACISSILCLAFTFTRSAWGAFFVGLLVIILTHLKNINIKVILFILVGFICVYSFIPQMYVKRMETAIYFQDSSSQKHLHRMNDGVELFKEKPLTGHGWKESSKWRFHNLYLQLGAAIGLFGVLLFLLIQWMLLAMGIRAVRQTKNQYFGSILTGLIAAMTGTFFSFSWGNALFDIDVIIPFWFEMSLIAVLYRVIFESKKR